MKGVSIHGLLVNMQAPSPLAEGSFWQAAVAFSLWLCWRSSKGVQPFSLFCLRREKKQQAFAPETSLLQGTRLLVLFAALHSSVALAQPIHETFIFSGLPQEDQIDEWSALPGTRAYIFQAMGRLDPDSISLRALDRLRGADRIQVEVSRYPGEDTLEAWRLLASHGVELVVIGSGLPTDDEIRRLNEGHFTRLILVSTAYPGPEEGKRLEQLNAEVSLSFPTRVYPRFMDKDGLLAVPAQIPLLIATDYWPSYTHMDLFNLLPHAVRLRVADLLPHEEDVQYLLNIKRLRDVDLTTDFDPTPEEWRRLGSLRTQWTVKNRVPSESSLSDFKQGRALAPTLSLIIDQDQPLDASDRAMLERQPFAVEWIHSVARSEGYRR